MNTAVLLSVNWLEQVPAGSAIEISLQCGRSSLLIEHSSYSVTFAGYANGSLPLVYFFNADCDQLSYTASSRVEQLKYRSLSGSLYRSNQLCNLWFAKNARNESLVPLADNESWCHRVDHTTHV
jgi:hypothetical protein